jgi:hypothetical protein
VQGAIAAVFACIDSAVLRWLLFACSLLQQIIEVNNGLRHGLEKGLPITSLMENWDFLQVRQSEKQVWRLTGCSYCWSTVLYSSVQLSCWDFLQCSSLGSAVGAV